MNRIVAVFLMVSFINAQFFDEEPDLTALEKATLSDSIPNNMPLIKNIFWSDEGLLRRLDLAPKSRFKELELRRDMLQLHQKTALVNLGLMSYQYYLGHEMDKDYENRSRLHKSLGYASFGLYMTSAGLSVFSPPALKYDKGVSSINIHRFLSVIHFSGMIMQPFLGYQISNSNCHSDYYYELHKDVGNVVFVSYLLSFLVTLI
tara:strand:- start:407 stop:1018 length:612 start_codon:yes stop_codon:yes gene_type:complete